MREYEAYEALARRLAASRASEAPAGLLQNLPNLPISVMANRRLAGRSTVGAAARWTRRPSARSAAASPPISRSAVGPPQRAAAKEFVKT